MNWNDFEFSPILGEKLTVENSLKLDFSAANGDLAEIDLADTATFETYVLAQLNSAGKSYGIGGYLEKRAIYRRSEVFATSASDYRNIHLGVDIWTSAGAAVFAPFGGKIHSFQDNVGFGNYGPTIILEHELGGKKLHSLYGHLCRGDLERLQIDQKVTAGELIAHIGPFPENGDWPAHLHFQLMWELNGYRGDYPGVATEKELEFYQTNCPDPNGMLRCGLLC